jgi:hypothetical protein
MIVWLLFFGLNLLASLIALLRERGEDPRFEGDKLIYRSWHVSLSNLRRTGDEKASSPPSRLVPLFASALVFAAQTVLFKNVNIRDDLADYKRQIGYLPEEAHLYPFLSGLEYLELVGRLRGLPGRVIATRTASLLELFAMYPHRHTTLVTYSKDSGTPWPNGDGGCHQESAEWLTGMTQFGLTRPWTPTHSSSPDKFTNFLGDKNFSRPHLFSASAVKTTRWKITFF